MANYKAVAKTVSGLTKATGGYNRSAKTTNSASSGSSTNKSTNINGVASTSKSSSSSRSSSSSSVAKSSNATSNYYKTNTTANKNTANVISNGARNVAQAKVTNPNATTISDLAKEVASNIAKRREDEKNGVTTNPMNVPRNSIYTNPAQTNNTSVVNPSYVRKTKYQGPESPSYVRKTKYQGPESPSYVRKTKYQGNTPTIVINDEPKTNSSGVPETVVEILGNNTESNNPTPVPGNYNISQDILAAAADAATNGTGKSNVNKFNTGAKPDVTNNGQFPVNAYLNSGADDISSGQSMVIRGIKSAESAKARQNGDGEPPKNRVDDGSGYYKTGDGTEYTEGTNDLIEQLQEYIQTLQASIGPDNAYNDYDWGKSQILSDIQSAIDSYTNLATGNYNRLNDAAANLLLNQQLSNAKNNMSGYTSGEMSGAIQASNVQGNSSLASSFNDAAKEYWAEVLAGIASLASQRSTASQDTMSMLNGTYSSNLSNILSELVTGLSYGTNAAKINGISELAAIDRQNSYNRSLNNAS